MTGYSDKVETVPRHNPYADFGTTITGRRFIGRSDELRTIENRVFGMQAYGSLAVIGLPRIGKTSLIFEAVRRAAPRAMELRHVVVQANVGAFATFDDLLKSVIEDLAEEVRSRGFETPLIEKRMENAVDSPGFNFNSIRTVFKALRQENIRPVCIFDEFDAGRRVFRGTPHCFHWIRELCSNPEFKAAVVLVTKRRLQDVARLAGHDSDYWANVLMSLSIKPLSDAEVAIFFDRLTEEGIVLGDAERSEVVALCGGHPYLLDAFAFHAWEDTKRGKEVDVDWIGRRAGTIVLEYVRQMSTILGDGPMLSKAVQVLVGPQWDVTREDVDALCELGVLLQDDTAGLRGFSRTVEDHLRFVGLDDDVWGLWHDTERALRTVLERQLSQKFGISWPDALCRARPRLRSMIEDCQERLDMERTRFGDRAAASLLAYTYPQQLYDLMCVDWPSLGAPLLGNKQGWNMKFDLLSKMRTPFAHNREESVSPGARTQAQGYCKEILERYEAWRRLEME